MVQGVRVADRFELLEIAGSGGMGTVWRARDAETGRPVAVKIVAGTVSRRFLREAELLARLAHPAIVSYVAHGGTVDGSYIAMEWLEGEDLAARLKRGPLPIGEAIELARRAAEALSFAHRRGVVHRDLKPANLFLREGRVDQVKVLDFGVAHVVGAATLTRAGALLGTPGYLAPEQVRGDVAVDARTDVFALGCVLHECLTGRPPFAGEHVLAVLAKVLLESPADVAEVRPDVPEGLAALVRSMMEKEPDRRPESCAAVSRSLAALAALAGPRAEPPRLLAESITPRERRLFSVVLSPAGPDRTVGDAEHARGAAELARIGRAHDAHIELLADGSVLAVLRAEGAAGELATRAVRCALSLRDAFPCLAVATGHGEVAAGLPVGEVLDRATALVRDRAAGVHLDEATAGLLPDRFEIAARPAGLLACGEREAAGPVVPAPPGAPPCVGRRRELRALASIHAGAVEERTAAAVLVLGEPGIGKTRLCLELVALIAAGPEPPEIWLAGGDPMRAASPFALLGQLLRSACGIHEDDDEAVRRARLRARVEAAVPTGAAERAIATFGALIGFPAAGKESRVAGEVLRSAFGDLVLSACRTGPLLVLLDDAQWIDGPSLSVMEAALRASLEQPLTFLLAGRREAGARVAEPFRRLRLHHELSLGPLGRRGCAELATAVAPGITEAEIDALCARSQGNPFFLEELLRARATRPPGQEARLPATVLAMLEARLDAMEPEARRLLRAASIFGQSAPVDGVRAVLGGRSAPIDVGEWIATLNARGVLVRSGDRPGEQTFRQPLVREAVYASLTEDDRRLGHRLAAAFIEGRGEPEEATLAEHHERGGDPVRAARSFRRAAEQALARSEVPSALLLADRGLSCAPDAEESGLLHAARAEALGWQGDHRGAVESGRKALALLAEGSAGWCAAAGDTAFGLSRLGEREELAALVDRVVALTAGDVAPSVAAGTLVLRLGHYVRFSGQVELTVDIDRLVIALERRGAFRTPAERGRLATLRAAQARVVGDLGGYTRQLRIGREAYTALGLERQLANVESHVGYALRLCGALDESAALLRAVHAMSVRHGLRHDGAVALHNLSLALGGLGRHEEAARAAAEALALFRSAGNAAYEAAARVSIARLARERGDLATARAEATLARDLDGADAEMVAAAEVVVAAVDLADGRHREAGDGAGRALARMAEAPGLHELELVARVTHAEALRALGEAAAARDAIATARRRIQRTVAGLPPELRAGYLQGGPGVARALQLADRFIGPEEVAPPAAMLSTVERRLVSVVLCAGPIGAPPRARGARIERLGDGSIVATLIAEPGEPPSDLAAAAARLALQLAAGHDGPVALATGRARLAEGLPLGPIIDAAAAMVALDRRGVRVDELTAGLLPARFDVSGDAQGLVLHAEREVGPALRTVLGRPAPFVGRDAEMTALEQLLSGAASGKNAAVALVIGGAGSGKTRMRHELLRRLAVAEVDAPAQVWSGRGDRGRAASPHALVGDALRRSFGLHEHEAPEVLKKKLRARVSRQVDPRAVDRIASFLGELCGIPFPDDSFLALGMARRDPSVMGDLVRRAFEDLVLAEAAAGPLVLLLDDLQWGDLPSVRLVEAALARARSLPLVVVAFARPEVTETFPALFTGHDVRRIDVGPLPPDASERLVHELLGPRAGRAAVARVVSGAQGNPFLLEELIRAEAEGRVGAPPETAIAAVQSRLEALEPELRRVLRAASVFGERVWRDGIGALLGPEHAAALDGWLDRLRAHELLDVEPHPRFPGQRELRFRHDLVREAAHAMLTDEDRAIGHRLAGAWLERAGERDPLVLAEHFEKGGLADRAAPFFARAAGDALEGGDFLAAVARAERAAACGVQGEPLGRLRLLQAEACKWGGDFVGNETYAVEAMALLPIATRPWFEAAVERAHAGKALGRTRELDALAAELCEVAGRVDHGALPAAPLLRVAIQLLLAGSGRLAADIGALAEGAIAHEPLATPLLLAFRGHQALVAGAFFDYLEGMRAARRAVELVGHERGAVAADIHIGHALLELGAHDEAETRLRAALAESRRLALDNLGLLACHHLSRVLARLGIDDEAEAMQREASAGLQAQGDRRLAACGRAWLADLRRARGDLGGAGEEAARAADLLAEAAPAMRPLALAVLARTRVLAGRADEAVAVAVEALRAIDAPAAVREHESLVRLAHVEALRAAGSAGARDAARDACARLLSRAAAIVAPGLRHSFLHAVPEHVRTLSLGAED